MIPPHSKTVRCYSARAGEFVDRKVRVTPRWVAVPLDDEVSYPVGAAGECVRRVVARGRRRVPSKFWACLIAGVRFVRGQRRQRETKPAADQPWYPSPSLAEGWNPYTLGWPPLGVMLEFGSWSCEKGRMYSSVGVYSREDIDLVKKGWRTENLARLYWRMTGIGKMQMEVASNAE